MRLVVFCGPTITAEQVRQNLKLPGSWQLQTRDPVRQGDILRVLSDEIDAILLIDGTYERHPAVWHKEILTALHAGVFVGGCSSMGAIRAAECAVFGMVGFGEVFRRIAAGDIVADDHVAVAHLAAEHDWRPVSVALVDIEATLARAVPDGILSEQQACWLHCTAQRVFYAERKWPTLVDQLSNVDKRAAERLCSWLPDGHYSLKQADALVACVELPHLLAHHDRAEPAWNLAETTQLRRARSDASSGLPVDLSEISELLRLEGQWMDTYRAAMLRHLALVDADRRRESVDDQEAMRLLYDALGLDEAETAKWANDNALSNKECKRFAVEQVLIGRCWQRYGEAAANRIVDHLRVQSTLSQLLDRAATRRRELQNVSADSVTDDEAWLWWLQSAGLPANADPHIWAEQLGFDHSADLLRLVREEYALYENDQ